MMITITKTILIMILIIKITIIIIIIIIIKYTALIMKSGKIIQTEGIDLLAKGKIYRSLDEDSEGYKYLGISR